MSKELALPLIFVFLAGVAFVTVPVLSVILVIIATILGALIIAEKYA